MTADRFTLTEADVAAGGARVFKSAAEADAHLMRATIQAAASRGFDTWRQESAGQLLLGKSGTAETVRVFKDGTWLYADATGDEPEQQTGDDATSLGWFLDATPGQRQQMEGGG